MADNSTHGAVQSNYETMSTEVLKAMANPLRRRLVRALSVAGSGRAADLAQSLDVPANKLSFHLRTLAQAGLIEEAPELARDGRDRVWRPVRKARSVGSPQHPVADKFLGDQVLAGVVEDDMSVLNRVAAWAPGYTSGEDPVVRGTLTDMRLRLSRERFVAMIEAMSRVVEEFRGEQEAEDALGWDLVILAASDEI